MWKSLQKNSRQLRGVMNVWHRNDKLLTLLFSIHQMKQGMQVLADSCPSAKPLQDSSFQAVQSLSNSQTYSAKVKHEDTFIHPSVVKWNQFLTPKKKKTYHFWKPTLKAPVLGDFLHPQLRVDLPRRLQTPDPRMRPMRHGSLTSRLGRSGSWTPVIYALALMIIDPPKIVLSSGSKNYFATWVDVETNIYKRFGV